MRRSLCLFSLTNNVAGSLNSVSFMFDKIAAVQPGIVRLLECVFNKSVVEFPVAAS